MTPPAAHWTSGRIQRTPRLQTSKRTADLSRSHKGKYERHTYARCTVQVRIEPDEQYARVSPAEVWYVWTSA